jgi:hypothetical protein
MSREWIQHLKHRLAMFEREALRQRRLAQNKEGSLPDARKKSLRYAELLEQHAKGTLQELKGCEESL